MNLYNTDVKIITSDNIYILPNDGKKAIQNAIKTNTMCGMSSSPSSEPLENQQHLNKSNQTCKACSSS